MKVGFLTPEYHTEPRAAAGIARHVPKLAHWLADHGHEVTVFLPAAKDDTFVERPGVTVVRIGETKKPRWRASQRLRWIRSKAVAKRIEAAYAEGKIEVVHAHAEPVSYDLIMGGNVPTVVRISGNREANLRLRYDGIPANRRVVLRRIGKMLRAAPLVYTSAHCTARAMKEMVGRQVPVIRTPVSGMPPPDPTAHERYGLPPDYAIFCSGLITCKGILELVDALPDLFDAHPDLFMVFSGRDDLGANGRPLSEEVKLVLKAYESRYKILGSLPHADLFGLVQEARFVVAPSLLDNLPNVLLESMSLGKVVIGTRGVSFDEIIEDGMDGLLIEPGSVGSIQESMTHAWTMPRDRLDRMGAAALQKAQKMFNPDEILPQIVELYEQAIAQYGDPTS